MAGEEDAVNAYCIRLAVSFKHLVNVLALPLIDQELYSYLFVNPLVDRHDVKAKKTPLKDTAPYIAESLVRSSTTDCCGDALVALGGTELLVKALRVHEQQTLVVMQVIALRENLMSRIWACCDTYDDSRARVEETQFMAARLLVDHQTVSLLAVEAISNWRQALSRPYPFLLKNGENYLIKILQDVAALGATALVRSLSRLRLHLDPLCAQIDLHRLLHRMETMHRTRLVNSGAVWRRGLQPLRLVTSRGLPDDNGLRNGSGASPGKTRRRVWMPSPSCSTSKGGTGAPVTPSYGDTSADFLTEVRRLAAAIKKSTGTFRGSPPLLFSPESSFLNPASFCGTVAPPAAHLHYPTSPGGRGWVLQQQRLLSATRVLQEEASLQRELIEELYNLAHKQEMFVPFLRVTQLFGIHDKAHTGKDIPSDSWPIEKTEWLSFALGEGRVDRLGCISTARELLQSKSLLASWEHRMGIRTTDFAATTSSYSLSHASSVSSRAEGPLTPLQYPVSQAVPPSTPTDERCSSYDSDTSESTSETGSKASSARHGCTRSTVKDLVSRTSSFSSEV